MKWLKMGLRLNGGMCGALTCATATYGLNTSLFVSGGLSSPKVTVHCTPHTNTHIHTRTHARTHARTHTRTHARTQARTNTHTHTHTHSYITTQTDLKSCVR